MVCTKTAVFPESAGPMSSRRPEQQLSPTQPKNKNEINMKTEANCDLTRVRQECVRQERSTSESDTPQPARRMTRQTPQPLFATTKRQVNNKKDFSLVGEAFFFPGSSSSPDLSQKFARLRFWRPNELSNMNSNMVLVLTQKQL